MILPEFSLLICAFCCFCCLLRKFMGSQRIIPVHQLCFSCFYVFFINLRKCFLVKLAAERALEIREFYYCNRSIFIALDRIVVSAYFNFLLRLRCWQCWLLR